MTADTYFTYLSLNTLGAFYYLLAINFSSTVGRARGSLRFGRRFFS